MMLRVLKIKDGKSKMKLAQMKRKSEVEGECEGESGIWQSNERWATSEGRKGGKEKERLSAVTVRSKLE